MAYKHTKDIVVKIGSYMKDGKEKGRYINVGKVLTGDDGKEIFMLNRTFSPAGVPSFNDKDKEHIILSVFEAKQYNNAPETASNIDETDLIPF